MFLGKMIGFLVKVAGKTGVVSLFLALVLNTTLQARDIVDMAGRRVRIPDDIKRLVPYDNKTNVLLFPVAGDLLVAKARAMESPDLKYISPAYLRLREVDTKSSEEVLKLRPDVLIVGSIVGSTEDITRYTAFSEKIRVPLIVVDLDLMRLDKTYEFLGKLLDRPKEAGLCVDFIRGIYSDVKTRTTGKRVGGKAYLANDNNGQRTAPDGSNHEQVFNVMKVQNVAKTDLDEKGFALVSMEDLMVWKPEYIFCIGKGENSPYRTVLKSVLWRNLPAVKNKRVYNVPSEPFLWFDMPPSVNRLLGLIWFNGLFYGQPPATTMQQVQNFYRLFYKYNLSEKEYRHLFSWQ
jgi:iron complex transport system substrate-binding protein